MVKNLPTIKDLFAAGAHFGHRRNHTDARTHQYVFGYRNKVAVINLEKTIEQIKLALNEVKTVAENGGAFLFVGTKLQAKDLVKQTAEQLDQSYIVERWPGGLLTNFDVIIKGIKKMNETEKNLAENKYEHLKKKEILKIEKDLAKQKGIFGGLSKMDRRPDMLVVVDAKAEEISIAEARREGTKVIAICDTNSNPKTVDYPIIANDDSKKTIELILSLITDQIKTNFKPRAVATDERIEEKLEGKAKPVKTSSKEEPAKVEKEVKATPESVTVKKATKKTVAKTTVKKTAEAVKKETKTKKSTTKTTKSKKS